MATRAGVIVSSKLFLPESLLTLYNYNIYRTIVIYMIAYDVCVVVDMVIYENI